jgi:hypothetical protein
VIVLTGPTASLRRSAGLGAFAGAKQNAAKKSLEARGS